jgi:hypothetical protein
MDEVINGRIKLRASQFPSFLYDSEIDYDPNAPEEGFLRGSVLVRVCASLLHRFFSCINSIYKVYRHIFTGPGTALTGKTYKTVKGGKAKIHRQTEVTPETIAYAAVMVSFEAYVASSKLKAANSVVS